MTVPVLRVARLAKRIGARMVLADVSFELGAGCAIAVLGPNGAGKTTLLKVMAGLWRPSSGLVEWFGVKAPGNRADPRIAYVGHQSFLYGHLTARENLIFHARLFGIRNPGRAAEVGLAQMGLRWSQNDPVKTFSRGMVQRLAIARALIGAPRLLLLDEPYTGLDLTGQREVTAIFDAFKAGGGSIVLISHRPDEAYRIAEATLILKGGRIVWWAYRDTVTAEALAAEYLDHLAEGGGPHS